VFDIISIYHADVNCCMLFVKSLISRLGLTATDMVKKTKKLDWTFSRKYWQRSWNCDCAVHVHLTEPGRVGHHGERGVDHLVGPVRRGGLADGHELEGGEGLHPGELPRNQVHAHASFDRQSRNLSASGTFVQETIRIMDNLLKKSFKFLIYNLMFKYRSIQFVFQLDENING